VLLISLKYFGRRFNLFYTQLTLGILWTFKEFNLFYISVKFYSLKLSKFL
jgi:hypothetical protein